VSCAKRAKNATLNIRRNEVEIVWAGWFKAFVRQLSEVPAKYIMRLRFFGEIIIRCRSKTYAKQNGEPITTRRDLQTD
jgi:hypothetical protein